MLYNKINWNAVLEKFIFLPNNKNISMYKILLRLISLYR